MMSVMTTLKNLAPKIIANVAAVAVVAVLSPVVVPAVLVRDRLVNGKYDAGNNTYTKNGVVRPAPVF